LRRRRALELLIADMQQAIQNAPDGSYEVMILGDANVDPDNAQFAK